MFVKLVTVCCLCVFIAAGSTSDEASEKPSPKVGITVQATNYTVVPSVTYIVSAVECLEEAYSVYEDDEDRASLYAALFEEKYSGTWNVVVGYTAVYVHSKIYIETLVSDGKQLKKGSEGSEKLFFIFSSD